MNAPRALLLENIDPVAVELLGSAGYEVESVRGALDEADLTAALDGVTLLGIRSKTQVTAEALQANPQLTALGAFCIGTNQIDLAAASAVGTAVFNAPYSNTRSVVELVIAEIICLARPTTTVNFMVITVFQASGKKVQPLCLSLLRKGSLDVVFMLILNHAVGVSGIAWATPIADWIAFVISVVLIVPQLRQLKAET